MARKKNNSNSNPIHPQLFIDDKMSQVNCAKKIEDFIFEEIIVEKDIKINNPKTFKNVYYFLNFHKIDLFCILKVDQLAASSEWGYICPIDNKSWDKEIIFYPEYELQSVVESINDPCIFVKVPLSWAEKCDLKEIEEYDFIPNKVKFISSYDSMFSFGEIIDIVVNRKYSDEISILSKTYNVEYNFDSKTIWKTRKEIQLLNRPPRLNYLLLNKLFGGIVTGAIEELFGILIDCGKINRNSKYIEPFGPYPFVWNNFNFFFDKIFLGSQGFSLLYSLESFIENGTICDLKAIQEKYLECLKDRNSKYEIPAEISIDLSRSIIWLSPIIIKYFEELKDGNAKNFADEITEILRINKLTSNIDNILAITIYGGFAASAISGTMWDNAQDGIHLSKGIIANLIKSLSNTDKNIYSESKCYKEFRNIFQSIENMVKEYNLKGVANLVNTIKMPNFYFEIVAKSLSILWATDTMSKDWYNVFNRAFNGNVNHLKYIFPILGSLMGFLHGYKAINRRKNYRFSNDEYLELVADDFIKKLLNKKTTLNNRKIESFSIQSHYSKSIDLMVFKFTNGLELPILFQNRDQEQYKHAMKTALAEEIISKVKAKRQIEKEIDILISKSQSH